MYDKIFNQKELSEDGKVALVDVLRCQDSYVITVIKPVCALRNRKQKEPFPG